MVDIHPLGENKLGIERVLASRTHLTQNKAIRVFERDSEDVRRCHGFRVDRLGKRPAGIVVRRAESKSRLE